MESNWSDTLITNYYNWLKDNTIITSGKDNWILINTPYIGLFNDTIEFYIKRNNDTILFSDDGKTLADLELLGINFAKSQKRREIFNKIIINYGLKFDSKKKELLLESSKNNFAQKKHNFISAILELNDLYILSENEIASIFKEDVRNYLDKNDIIYTPDFISRGYETSIEYSFDFQIAGRSSEVVIKSFRVLNKPLMSHFLFSWGEIKPTREKISRKELKAIAIIDNVNNKPKQEYIDAMKQKQSDVLLWSERESQESLSKLKK